MSEEDRDFLAEAKQSRELALAMAEISTLTASATASLSRLDHTSIINNNNNNTTDSSSSDIVSPPLTSTIVSSESSQDDHDYPDMSKYYSGNDYVSTLQSSTSPSSYSSSFNLFSSSKKNDDESSFDSNSLSSKYRLADTLSSSKTQNSGGGTSIMRKVYAFLVLAFIVVIFVDVFQQQLPNLTSSFGGNTSYTSTSKGISVIGNKNRNISNFHGNGLKKLPNSNSKKNSKDKEPLTRLMIFGRHGGSPGNFNQPMGLAMIRKRFLFVSDFGNKRIQMLHFHGAPDLGEELENEKRSGKGGMVTKDVFEYALEMDQIGGPMAMCTIGDYVIIAEWGMHRLKIIKIDSKAGTLVPIGFYGQFGYADEEGKFNHPRGIAVQTSSNHVVVTDENDHIQVLKFSEHPTPSLTFVSSFGRATKGKASKGKGDVLGFFKRPSGVAIHGESGLVFVVDSKNFRIQTLRLTAEGHLQPVSKFGAGGGFNFAKEPTAISLHPTHPLLMVAEEGSQCLHEIMINPGGHLTLRRSHCGKLCSSLVTGSGLRVSGSRAAGPSSVLLMNDLVFITVADQVSLLKWTDWTM